MKKVDIELILALIEEAKTMEGLHTPTLNEDLWLKNHLDSFAVIKLITLFEERLGLVFDFTDLNVKNFQSAQSIYNLLVDKYKINNFTAK